jgi:hypothetical protein
MAIQRIPYTRASGEPSPVGGEARSGSILETAVVYHKEQFPIKPIVSMSCKEAGQVDQCIRQPRDLNNNPEEGVHDISDRVAEKNELIN